MKKKFFLVSLLLVLAFVANSRPGLAGTWNADSADLFDRLEKEGWQTVQLGVMQRQLEGDTVETLGFGADGFRFKLQEMKAHLAYLRREHALHPSPELRSAIRAHRAEILRLQAALKRGTKAGKLESASDALVATGTNCTANYDATAILPLNQGVGADASASFNNACGYVGEVYAHAHAKATTPANQVVSMTKSDPALGSFSAGVNVTSSALAAVNGVTDCYRYAYASVTSYDLELTYIQSASSSTCPNQTPYHGIPFTVPGVIKAADFDNGGEGVAYHKEWPSPYNGSPYRTTEVHLHEDTVNHLRAGEWLEYTIDVVSPGTYSIIAQVGAEGPGSSFHVELDGVDVTGSLVVPFEKWAWGSTLKAGVSFPSGRHVLRVAIDSTYYVVSFYSLRIVPAQTPFGGTPRTLPGTIRAVDFDEGGEQIGYHDNTVGCNGSCGYRLADVDRWEKVVYRTGTGEWLKYTVDVTAAGTYTLALRVNSDEQGAIFHVEFDGVDVTGPLTMPMTGGVFQTITRPGVSLTAGRKVMRLVIDDAKGCYDAGAFDTITLQP